MFRSAESEVQVISTTISSTQTELQEQATEQLIQQNQDEPEPPGLKDFLQQVEDMVVRELVKNVRSHAFDGFQASWEDHSQRVSRTLVCMSERVCHLLQKESTIVILLPDGLYHEVKVKQALKSYFQLSHYSQGISTADSCFDLPKTCLHLCMTVFHLSGLTHPFPSTSRR